MPGAAPHPQAHNPPQEELVSTSISTSTHPFLTYSCPPSQPTLLGSTVGSAEMAGWLSDEKQYSRVSQPITLLFEVAEGCW